MTATAAAAVLRVEETAELAMLERWREDWDALWQRCPSATPFQSAAWLVPWWRHFPDDELWAMALRDGERLVGLAPFYLHRDRPRRERRLLFLGMSISDYLGALFEPARELEGALAVLRQLDVQRDRWDSADLQEMRDRGPLLRARKPAGWTGELLDQSICPVLTLPSTVDELLASYSGGRRRKLRVARRKLDATGDVRIESCRTTAEIPQYLDALVDLHERRWHERQQEGLLADPTLVAFHRDAAAALHALGALRLHRLLHGDAVAAVLYGFAHGDRWYSYLVGFDPAKREMSPGTLLIQHAIEQAIGEGRRTFDFLRGQERYKYGFTDREERTRRCILRHSARPARPA